MTLFRIENACRSQMAAAGLETFEDCYEKPVGVLLSRDRKGRELWRVSVRTEGGPRDLFVKRIGREPLAKLAQMLLFGRRPRCGPLRELALLQALQRAGFATMRQIAWGEKRLLGWPLGGFLVVEQVQGTEVAELVRSRDRQLLGRLYYDLGIYLGGLHRAGFLQVVRLKDLFCPTVPAASQGRFDFILIDRESSKPWKKRFSAKQGMAALARTARRVLRDGFHPGRAELRAFFRGYLEACRGSSDAKAMGAFRRAFFCALRAELGAKR